MAKTGIERLREAAGQTKHGICCICEAADIDNICEFDCDYVRGMALTAICKQIEDEHLAELNEMREAHGLLLHEVERKRELTDEARKAVERLRELKRHIYASDHDFYECLKRAIGYRGGTYTGACDRLCELLENGGKQDVVGAPKPGTVCECETHAQDRDTAAAWVEENGGLKKVEEMRVSEARYFYRIHRIARACGVSPRGLNDDETEKAIMAELDKRLMPPGMEWPRFEDGAKVEFGEMFLRFDGKHENDGEGIVDIAIHGGDYLTYRLNGDYQGCQLVKRPEPEVLGADGLPIKVGETVYDKTGGIFHVFEVTRGGIETTCGYLPANEVTHTPPDVLGADGKPIKVDETVYHDGGMFEVQAVLKGAASDEFGDWYGAGLLTHTPPDTQERIDEDAKMSSYGYLCKHDRYDETTRLGNETRSEIRTRMRAAKWADLLIRQRALDARTNGGE